MQIKHLAAFFFLLITSQQSPTVKIQKSLFTLELQANTSKTHVPTASAHKVIAAFMNLPSKNIHVCA